LLPRQLRFGIGEVKREKGRARFSISASALGQFCAAWRSSAAAFAAFAAFAAAAAAATASHLVPTTLAKALDPCVRRRAGDNEDGAACARKCQRRRGRPRLAAAGSRKDYEWRSARVGGAFVVRAAQRHAHALRARVAPRDEERREPRARRRGGRGGGGGDGDARGRKWIILFTIDKNTEKSSRLTQHLQDASVSIGDYRSEVESTCQDFLILYRIQTCSEKKRIELTLPNPSTTSTSFLLSPQFDQP
jgi:hypothetical protein